MKILWLPSWYPNQTETFAGDFIKRHAEAASLFHDVEIIHIVRDISGRITKDVSVERRSGKRLKETIVYYYAGQSSLPGKLLSYIKYKRLYKQFINEYIRQSGKPDLVHIHVGMKVSRMEKWIRQMDIPYVITEHWTGFLPDADDRFEQLPFFLKKAWRRLVIDAKGVSAVSGYLAKHLQRVFGNHIAITTIPNVVNTDIFFPASGTESKRPRFIHISGLSYQKNPEVLLNAFSILKSKNVSFDLDIFGPQKKGLREMANGLGLSKEVRFHNEIPQPDLAKFVQAADALVLCSRYETFGCVLIEANACGIPVIASDIPAIREIVRQDENGLLAQENDPIALADTIEKFISEKSKFQKNAIAARTAEKYSYAKVGGEISDWYRAVLTDDHKHS